jgi:hypothetical protein
MCFLCFFAHGPPWNGPQFGPLDPNPSDLSPWALVDEADGPVHQKKRPTQSLIIQSSSITLCRLTTTCFPPFFAIQDDTRFFHKLRNATKPFRNVTELKKKNRLTSQRSFGDSVSFVRWLRKYRPAVDNDF